MNHFTIVYYNPTPKKHKSMAPLRMEKMETVNTG